jgi:Rps23 Pro-64 3,4-dihydroxylase Tpa1-like proline 4-hydroxylase
VTLYHLYCDVLGTEANASILAMAIRQQAQFEHSRVAPRRIDPRSRVSTVVYDDRLGDVSAIVRAAVEARLGEALPDLGIAGFEPAAFELQLTSHNDGEFFLRHTDSCSHLTASRTVAFVYYFHRQPKAHSGGELAFFDAEGRVAVIEPPNDSMVLFDPRTPHEVRPVSCPSGRFEDGRFTLNGWLHRRPVTPRTGFAFDQRIFTPVGRWSATTAKRHASAGTPAKVAAPPRRPSLPDPNTGTAALRNLLKLYGDLHRQRSDPEAIDVRPDLTGAQFFDEYYTRNRPVLMPGLLADSAAVANWSPDYFARHFGSVPIEITNGREQNPDYEVRYRETVRTTTLAEFVERLASTAESNDFYLVARNSFFDRAPLKRLREQLRPPADIIDTSERTYGAMKMWFGPKGTVTPLHFDEHSILFAQVYGRKQLKLIPSFDYHLMYVRDRFYSEVDPTNVDIARNPLFADASVVDVEVNPGDALFLPAAWWHWARSLSVSISTTFSSFAIAEHNTPLTRS